MSKISVIKMMSRALVFLLYGVAVLIGVAGLIIGGVPLVNYTLMRWRDPTYDYYSNFGMVSTAVNIVILSLLLLIFVHISHVIRCRFQSNPKKPVLSSKQQTGSSLPANSISQPAETSKDQPAEETPDQKLARLINMKKK
jgi:hypothetical protein